MTKINSHLIKNLSQKGSNNKVSGDESMTVRRKVHSCLLMKVTIIKNQKSS